jgi:hypothetical protein
MRKTIFIAMFLVPCLSNAQDHKPLNFSVGAGVGVFHYFNTLDIGGDRAEVNHLGYTFRFHWEPEHRLSMGIESGFYTIYTTERPATPSGRPGGNASLTTIPLLLSFRVRVLPNLYISGGPGMAIMYSNVTVLRSTASSSFMSMANLHVSAMYCLKLSDRFDIGGEIKFLNFGKTEDYGYSLQVVGAYRLRFKN